MLQSVDDAWDEMTEKLSGSENASKIEGIDRHQVQLLIKFLGVFKESSSLLEGENYPTLPLVLLSKIRFLDHCKQEVALDIQNAADEEDIARFLEPEPEAFAVLRRNVSNQLQTTLQVSMQHKMATVLHPRYRKLAFLSQEDRDMIFGKIREEIAAMETSSFVETVVVPRRGQLDAGFEIFSCTNNGEDSGFGPEHNERDELDQYLREASDTTTEDLLEWWKTKGKAYPKLQALARRLLGIPASSASSERVFSKAGFIVNSRRKRLHPKTVDAIIFLHQHLRKKRVLARTEL
ncbi:E3 SUMO-protein ligase ZBED1 [Frankliniella fusca]|uniref:E3 SUMO-protein ligase ZBED1 n=1 Tax=Frankliniella fusca TaxID=407009 RepID=A0AAE1HGV0_9NEOP|nr:E3 SUMO-protein ligase ZBED1 [Frankliniella fusca]